MMMMMMMMMMRKSVTNLYCTVLAQGKSIGKHVFLSRSNMPGHGMSGFKNGAPMDNRARLRELELKFYNSLVQESDTSTGLSFAGQTPVQAFAQNHGMGMAGSVPLHPFIGFPTPPTTATASAPPPLVPAQPMAAAAAAAAGAVPWQQVAPPPQTGAAPTINGQQANQLHQAYLHAVNPDHQQPPNHNNNVVSSAGTLNPPPPGANPTQPLINPTHPIANPTQTFLHPPKPVPNNISHSPVPSSLAATETKPVVAPAPGSFAPLLPLPSGGNAPSAGSSDARGSQVSPSRQTNGTDTTTMEGSTTSTAKVDAASSAQNPYSDLPDFLSGFEKVVEVSSIAPTALSNESEKFRLQSRILTPTVQGQTGVVQRSEGGGVPNSEYSPPFTSRSFDDFHRFLGKGLSHQALDLNGNKKANGLHHHHHHHAPTGNQVVANHPDVMHGMQPTGDSSLAQSSADPQRQGSTVTADSYAVFAQQSALAVSQHSAYCRTDRTSAVTAKAEEGLTNNPTMSLSFPFSQANTFSESTFSLVGAPPVVNAANLRAHAMATENQALSGKSGDSHGIPTQAFPTGQNIVSASEKSNSGTESESGIGSSRGSSGTESNTTSDNASDNASNDSDSNSLEPVPKKRKVEHSGAAVPSVRRDVSPVAQGG